MRAEHASLLPCWPRSAAQVAAHRLPPCSTRELAALSAFGVDPDDEDEVYNLPHTDLK